MARATSSETDNNRRLEILQAAGDVVHIGWTHKTKGELIDVLARS